MKKIVRIPQRYWVSHDFLPTTYVGDWTLASRGSFLMISRRVRQMHTKQFPSDDISTQPHVKLSLGPPDLLPATLTARSKYLRADNIWLASDCWVITWYIIIWQDKKTAIYSWSMYLCGWEKPHQRLRFSLHRLGSGMAHYDLYQSTFPKVLFVKLDKVVFDFWALWI